MATRSLSILVSFGAIAFATSAAAQDATSRSASGEGPQAETGASQQNDASLQEIIVTAQKRSESAQSVPISIAAVSGATLAQSGAVNLENVQRLTPGLTISTIGTGWVSYTYIRGVGTSQVDPRADPSVAYFIDEVYLGGSSGLQFDLSDIERIEVLKGPQGTLFGRNTSGGAISIITKKPSDKFGLDFTADAGNYNLLAGRGSVTGPLTSDGSLRYRLSGSVRHRDPVTQNLGGGRDPGKVNTWGARGSLEYVGSDLTAQISADYFHSNYGMANTFLLTPCVAAPVNTCFLSAGGAAKVAANPGQTFFRGYYDHPDGFERQRVWSVTGRLEWTLPFATLTSISAYRRNDFSRANDQDGSIADGYTWNTDELDRTFSQELRLAHTGDKFDWLAGLYYYNARTTREDFWTIGADIAIPPLRNTIYRDFSHITTESFAAFGQGTYHFTDEFSLSVGGRYTHDRKKDDRTVVLAIAAGGGYSVNPSNSWQSFDPAVTIEYKANQNFMLYGSYRRGFKSGGYQTVLQSSPVTASLPYNPEHVNSFEAGIKSEWFNRRLRVNIAGFHTQIKGQQVSRVDVSRSAAIIIDNAGTASANGVDLAISAQITRAFSIDWAATYQQARFDKYDTIVGGVPTSYAGNHQPRSPDFMLSAAANYVLPLGSWGSATVHGDWFHQSRVFFQAENFGVNPSGIDISQRKYDVFNARLTVAPSDGPWELSGWVKNIGDTHYCRNIANVGLSGLCSPGDPRTYGLTVGLHF